MLRILLGFACNNRCVFCAQGDLRSRMPRAEIDQIEEELDGVQAGSTVAFIGGEPTLFDELPEWVSRARARGAGSVLVQTNGRRLQEPGYVARLLAAGLTRIDVSLHGSNAAMHDFHTTVPGSFEETTRGIRSASEGGAGVGVTTVVTRANFRHLQEIVRLAAELGASAMHIAVAKALGAGVPGPNGLAARAPRAGEAPPPALLRPYWTRALAASRDLGLPCVAAGAPSDTYRGADAWFAGIGIAES